MHIFLSGPIQVGKSTVIRKSLSLLGQPVLGGFRSLSLPTEIPYAQAEVYIGPAAGGPIQDRDHLLGVRWGEGMFTAFPGAFESGGVDILQHPPREARLLLMDELGMLESRAPHFRESVLAALDGHLPILGVVKPLPIPFLDAIRSHPNVQVLDVTRENREQLPEEVAALLRPQLLP